MNSADHAGARLTYWLSFCHARGHPNYHGYIFSLSVFTIFYDFVLLLARQSRLQRLGWKLILEEALQLYWKKN